jgi:hypothetical protein
LLTGNGEWFILKFQKEKREGGNRDRDKAIKKTSSN